jgi:hypothetical protein
VVGGVWTLNHYFEQEQIRLEQYQRELEREKRATMIRFSSELSDLSKREAAAIHLALFGGEQSAPILISHLLSTIRTRRAEKRQRLPPQCLRCEQYQAKLHYPEDDEID